MLLLYCITCVDPGNVLLISVHPGEESARTAVCLPVVLGNTMQRCELKRLRLQREEPVLPGAFRQVLVSVEIRVTGSF